MHVDAVAVYQNPERKALNRSITRCGIQSTRLVCPDGQTDWLVLKVANRNLPLRIETILERDDRITADDRRFVVNRSTSLSHWTCSEIRSRVLRSATVPFFYDKKKRHSSTSKHSGAYFRTRPL